MDKKNLELKLIQIFGSVVIFSIIILVTFRIFVYGDHYKNITEQQINIKDTINKIVNANDKYFMTNKKHASNIDELSVTIHPAIKEVYPDTKFEIDKTYTMFGNPDKNDIVLKVTGLTQDICNYLYGINNTKPQITITKYIDKYKSLQCIMNDNNKIELLQVLDTDIDFIEQKNPNE